MHRHAQFVADAGVVIRSVGITALAVALGVYAMLLQERRAAMAVLGAIVLVVAVIGMLQVGRAIRRLHRRHHEVSKAAAQAEHHYFKVLRRLLAVIEAREQYTRGRSRRIGFLARQMGEQLGMDRRECVLLGLAGQVHDIGLLAVPDRILNKPSRLGSQEFKTVQKHAETSYKILEPLTFLAEILPSVRYHHERMNGTGYPFQLRGEQIPLAARVLAVADAYDAMTHDRPHRAGLPSIEAINELRRCSPAGYDTRCVEALENVMNLRPLREAHEAVDSRTPALRLHGESPAARAV